MKSVKKMLWTSFFITILVSTIMVAMLPMISVASASPNTYIWVDPQEVKDVSSGGTFLVNISVNEAPDTYTWEIYLNWDPDLLELVQLWDPYWEVTVDVMEGDFLDRRYWDDVWEEWVKTYETTFLSSPSLTEANVQGEIMVGCSLKGEVPWANATNSPDGWLCTLKFSVKAEGASVLNLFDTWLADHMFAGSPAPTYYPNLDGFFYNREYPATSKFHNVTVDNVVRNVTDMWVNAPGDVGIDVTVKNKGNYTETSETFNVTIYADTIPFEYTYEWEGGPLIKTTIDVGNEEVVGTQTITGSLAPGASTLLSFTWDTSGIDSGNWTISALVQGDDDTRDNLFIDDTVLIREHDLEITNVHVAKNTTFAGESATIIVSVLNNGTEPETFDIYVYLDKNIGTIGDEINFTGVAGASLDAGDADTYIIYWDTTGAELNATYTVSAYVPPATGPVYPEVDTGDNTLTDGTVRVRMPGDVNDDGTVDDSDVTRFGEAYGAGAGDPNWDEDCDFNGDLKIDASDVFKISEYYGVSV